MKKVISLFFVAMVLFSLFGASILGDEQGDVEKFVKGIEKQNQNITSIEKVDLQELPKEVTIEKFANDTNIAVYKANTGTGKKPVFVITFGNKTISAVQKAPPSATYAVSLLSFGLSGQTKSSDFMKTASGVKTSKEKGYVMTRKGSIIGVSTSLESMKGEGIVHITIYKNGDPLNFENKFDISSEGVKKDYDIQSRGIVDFEEGDVISVYLNDIRGATISDATTIVEIAENIS